VAPINLASAASLLIAMVVGGIRGSATPEAATPEITVTATDYAFLALPAIRPGRTIFAFVNKGKLDHEVAIGRLKATATPEDYVKAAPGAERRALLDEFVGVLIAGPGKSGGGKLLVDLAKGERYLVWCAFRDKPDAPQHLALGMYTTFTPR
jgi:hypothetical protein